MTIWDTSITEQILDERQAAQEVRFFGQSQIKAQVEPFLDEDKFPHALLSGDPGLGKTHFARWIAWRRKRPFYDRMAPVRIDELPVYGVLLLDESHRQRDIENLFRIMDEGLLTIIAATTKPEKLDDAFRSRFLLKLQLRSYSQTEMEEVIRAMAGGDPGPDAVSTFARASGGNPRQAELIVKTAKGLKSWDPTLVLQHAQVTADGLTVDHWTYLKALHRTGRPTGIEQLAMLSRCDVEDLRRAERLLLDLNLIDLRTNGRKLTLRGSQYIEVLKEADLI